MAGRGGERHDLGKWDGQPNIGTGARAGSAEALRQPKHATIAQPNERQATGGQQRENARLKSRLAEDAPAKAAFAFRRFQRFHLPLRLAHSNQISPLPPPPPTPAFPESSLPEPPAAPPMARAGPRSETAAQCCAKAVLLHVIMGPGAIGGANALSTNRAAICHMQRSHVRAHAATDQRVEDKLSAASRHTYIVLLHYPMNWQMPDALARPHTGFTRPACAP